MQLKLLLVNTSTDLWRDDPPTALNWVLTLFQVCEKSRKKHSYSISTSVLLVSLTSLILPQPLGCNPPLPLPHCHRHRSSRCRSCQCCCRHCCGRFAAASAIQGHSPICSHLRCNPTHTRAWSLQGQSYFEETRTIYYLFSSKIHVHPEKIKNKIAVHPEKYCR